MCAKLRNVEEYANLRDKLVQYSELIGDVLDGKARAYVLAEGFGCAREHISTLIKNERAVLSKLGFTKETAFNLMFDSLSPYEKFFGAVVGINYQVFTKGLVYPVLSEEAEAEFDKALRLRLPELFYTALSLRYGFEGEPKTYLELGRLLGVTTQRARQLCVKGLRMCRHDIIMSYFKHLSEVETEEIFGYETWREREDRLGGEVRRLQAENKRLLELLENRGVTSDSGKENQTRYLFEVTIEELDLHIRSYNCLKRAGFNTVGDIYDYGMDNLLKVRNLGRKSFEEIEDAIQRKLLTVKDGRLKN